MVQHKACLFELLKSCKNTIDYKGLAGAALMDLIKGFDCVDYGLLLAKLNTYELNSKALQLIRSYFKNRKTESKD